MEHLTIKLSDIRPSDLPRRDEWEDAGKLIEGIFTIRDVDLAKLGIILIRVGNSVVVKDGNHRMCKLIERFGGESSVGAAVEEKEHNNQGSWKHHLSRIEEEGIRTFADFLARARRGEFYR